MNFRNRLSYLGYLFMFSQVLESLAVFVSDNCRCGRVNDLASRVFSPVSFIVSGRVADEKSHPFLALLLRNNQLHCGGTLINSKYVLTAAHCFDEGTPQKNYTVWLGVHDRLFMDSGHEEEFQVADILIHDDYKVVNEHGSLDNDIALIRLNSNINFTLYIRPVCLPTIDVTGFSHGKVQGWGATKYNGYPSMVVREARLGLMNYENCLKSNVGPLLGDKATHMCATDMYADACLGDSGGPLFVTTTEGVIVQVGIVSFGVKCAEIGYPGIYSRVSGFLDWIYQHTPDQTYCAV